MFPSESSSKLDDELRLRPDFKIGFLGILLVEVSDMLTGRVAGCKRLKTNFTSIIEIRNILHTVFPTFAQLINGKIDNLKSQSTIY